MEDVISDFTAAFTFDAPPRPRRPVGGSLPLMSPNTRAGRIGNQLLGLRPHCPTEQRPRYVERLSHSTEGNDLADVAARAMVGPCGHQLPALVESIATAIRTLDLIADPVRKRSLGDLAWNVVSSPHQSLAGRD